MAWTTVPTFTSGQILTAVQMNGLGSDLNELRGDYMRAKRTSGNLSLASSLVWANLDTGLDLTLAADSGDVIEVCLSCWWSNEANEQYLDVVTLVSGSPVNSFGYDAAPANPSTSYGISGWAIPASRFEPRSATAWRKLAAGDVSGGNVVLRLRYASQNATARTLYATAAQPLEFWARNHGPVEI